MPILISAIMVNTRFLFKLTSPHQQSITRQSRIMPRHRTGLGAFILFLTAFSIYAQAGQRIFPENYEARLQNMELMATFGKTRIPAETEIVEQMSTDFAVMRQTKTQNESVYLLFTNEEQGEFPLYSAGSYILRRVEKSSVLSQVKIFIRSEPGSYLRIAADGKRSLVDVYLFGFQLYQNIVLPISLEQVVLEPFSRIRELSHYQIDWSLLLPVEARAVDHTARKMVLAAREVLDILRDSDDGAMDSDGSFRYIEDLTDNLQSGFNCSGFAKWIVDGLYMPRSGRLLSIDALKEKHEELRGNQWSQRYEDLRDPFFGLDWSRNLARSIIALDSPVEVSAEAADVRKVSHFSYIEDVGYSVDDLRIILYTLAVQQPGFFYIGSVNRDFGSDPVLKQHVHVVVLIPYFELNGIFRVAVLERNLETSISSLKRRYSGDHIHLVRIPVSDSFVLPSVE